MAQRCSLACLTFEDTEIRSCASTLCNVYKNPIFGMSPVFNHLNPTFTQNLTTNYNAFIHRVDIALKRAPPPFTDSGPWCIPRLSLW